MLQSVIFQVYDESTLNINRWKDHTMRAMKEARHLIEKSPQDESARILAQLVLALETEVHFEISDIYKLNRNHFDLALNILKDWRLDRYYIGKARLFDSALHVSDFSKEN